MADNRRILLVWISIVLAAAVNTAVFWGYIVDDAYIPFRYLSNLLAGNGLVFNPGERVESYSNFLWIVILYPLSLLGVPLTVSSRVIGAAFFFGTILIGKRLIDEINPESRRSTNLCLPLFMAACPHMGFWATAGLETPAFSFLLCTSV